MHFVFCTILCIYTACRHKQSIASRLVGLCAAILLWGSLHATCLLLLQRDLPYQLDNDLKTVGTTNLSDAIDTEKQYFGAHYRSVTEPDGSHRLIGFNFTEEAQNGVVNFWEFDDKFKRLSKEQVKLPVSGCCMPHTADYISQPLLCMCVYTTPQPLW